MRVSSPPSTPPVDEARVQEVFVDSALVSFGSEPIASGSGEVRKLSSVSNRTRSRSVSCQEGPSLTTIPRDDSGRFGKKLPHQIQIGKMNFEKADKSTKRNEPVNRKPKSVIPHAQKNPP